MKPYCDLGYLFAFWETIITYYLLWLIWLLTLYLALILFHQGAFQCVSISRILFMDDCFEGHMPVPTKRHYCAVWYKGSAPVFRPHDTTMCSDLVKYILFCVQSNRVSTFKKKISVFYNVMLGYFYSTNILQCHWCAV